MKTTQVINTTLDQAGVTVPVVVNLSHFEEQVNKIALQFRQFRKVEECLNMTDKDTRLVQLASDGMLRSETWATLKPARQRALLSAARAQLRTAVNEELESYGQYALLLVLMAGFFEDPFAYYRNSTLRKEIAELVEKPLGDDYFGTVEHGVLRYEIPDTHIEARLYYLMQLSGVLNISGLMRDILELVRQVREGERPSDTFPALGMASVLAGEDGRTEYLP